MHRFLKLKNKITHSDNNKKSTTMDSDKSLPPLPAILSGPSGWRPVLTNIEEKNNVKVKSLSSISYPVYKKVTKPTRPTTIIGLNGEENLLWPACEYECPDLVKLHLPTTSKNSPGKWSSAVHYLFCLAKLDSSMKNVGRKSYYTYQNSDTTKKIGTPIITTAKEVLEKLLNGSGNPTFVCPNNKQPIKDQHINHSTRERKESMMSVLPYPSESNFTVRRISSPPELSLLSTAEITPPPYSATSSSSSSDKSNDSISSGSSCYTEGSCHSKYSASLETSLYPIDLRFQYNEDEGKSSIRRLRGKRSAILDRTPFSTNREMYKFFRDFDSDDDEAELSSPQEEFMNNTTWPVREKSWKKLEGKFGAQPLFTNPWVMAKKMQEEFPENITGEISEDKTIQKKIRVIKPLSRYDISAYDCVSNCDDLSESLFDQKTYQNQFHGESNNKKEVENNGNITDDTNSADDEDNDDDNDNDNDDYDYDDRYPNISPCSIRNMWFRPRKVRSSIQSVTSAMILDAAPALLTKAHLIKV